MKDRRVFCDCGAPLIYEVDKVVINVQYRITKSGKIAKRAITFTNHRGSEGNSYNFGRLVCSAKDCSNRYEYDYTQKERRAIRGDLLE